MGYEETYTPLSPERLRRRVLHRLRTWVWDSAHPGTIIRARIVYTCAA